MERRQREAQRKDDLILSGEKNYIYIYREREREREKTPKIMISRSTYLCIPDVLYMRTTRWQGHRGC